MAEYPALPIFTDAYMADTRHLTTAQHGAYLLLLMTAWRMHDCRLPDDDRLLARWAGMDYRNWLKTRPHIIDQFWKKNDDGKLQQNRLLDERKYADSIRLKNSAAGKASALKRKDRHSTTVATKTQQNFNPHTLPTPIEETPIVPKGDFDAFYKLYPKKVGNVDAAKAYDKALKRASHEEIMAGAKKYRASVAHTEKKYIQAPAAWLNKGRWADEYDDKASQDVPDWIRAQR